MPNRQTLIALGVALILGVVAVFLANTYLSGTERKAQLGGTTKVAVATAPMAFGTDITPDKVRFVDYPNSSLPQGAFSNAAQLMPPGKRRVALLPIGVNEPILAAKISGEGQGASIAAPCPTGCARRAWQSMTFRASPASCSRATPWTSSSRACFLAARATLR